MKRILSVILACAMLFVMTACGQKSAGNEGETDAITMLVSLGNGESYYTALADLIKTELDIDVEFVYQISWNTSAMQELYFANKDLPADIIFSAAKMEDDLLKDTCVDLLSASDVTALYTHSALQNCTADDGAVYQLPVSSKLIGITYNETLLQEMGWSVPETFEDMLDLKAKCDEAGIKFAVSDGIATGHGFNWLFHLMGSQWLSTPEGTEWFRAFQAGEASVDEFKEQCEYFREWTEAGLWGSIHTADWNGSREFSTTRALFWFGLTNSVTGYEGPQLDEDGNETGVQLNDTYNTIPWISEDGSNNCYTYYDNCWIYLNKDLQNSGNSEKLEKALQIVEFLASDSATELISGIARDTYVSVNNYEMGEDRLYADYSESVKNGFIQPWYYNSFDADSINYVGAAVNAYLTGEGSFDEIFTVLDEYNQLELNDEIDVLADFPEGLDYEDTAKLVAVSAAEALDGTLEANGREERVEVSLVPYTPGANQLPPWRAASVSNSIVYEGELDSAVANTVLPTGVGSPVGVYLTGAEIKALMEEQFDPSDRFVNADTGESTFDSENYGPYPYVCLVKGGEELEDDREYLVALSDRFLTLARYNELSEAGKVITDLEGTLTFLQGLTEFAARHSTITSEDLVLE